jgi:micrococcal nuclease
MSPLTRALLPLAAVATGVVVLVGVVATAVTTSEDGQRATVVRVVDGNTLVVDYDDGSHRVRLLNVDTPETVDPGEPVQCLGPEATSFLRERLPPGTDVVLRFDEERLDRYGRELAGVFDADDVLVNAEIARAGLGVAVLYEPNRRFHRAVLDAQHEAERRELGLYSPTTACTLPAQVSDLEAGAAALVLAPESDLEALDSRRTELATLAAEASRLVKLLRREPAELVVGTYSDAARDALVNRVEAVAAKVRRDQRATDRARSAEVERVAAAEKAAREEAERRARRKAEKARAAAAARERARREAEAERLAEREAAAQAQREADERDRRAADDAPAGSESGDGDASSSGGGADPYTGCRAYGPGGTSVDDQGRRYTKIPC